MKNFDKVLFIFRRDLRIEDNTGLLFALKNAKKVIPCFIFTPEQVTHNSYKSDHCLQFMIESLEDLEESLKAKKGKLHLFFDDPEKVVSQCIKKLKIEAVIVNRDFTPYSRKRDEKIESVCRKEGVDFYALDDLLLQPPEETVKGDGKPYTIFTPFYRNAIKMGVKECEKNGYTHYDCQSIPFAEGKGIYKKILPQRVEQQKGGRSEALKILKNLKKYKSYSVERNFPSHPGTTHLSAHLKFNTCSVREIYHAIVDHLGKSSDLIRSLYWRDFFTSIAFHFPHVFGHSFQKKFENLSWDSDKKRFQLWCQGKTGFPIVDAGMREMNETGYMHNRVRMITASFLVKDLHIDWRWGEKYFAQKLIDYDPAVNNGNWQWAASTGCDAQPYFRIFNPWSQQIKFDGECVYIKHWIPELKAFSTKAIHNWFVKENRQKCDYPEPILDHTKESKKTLAIYRRASSR